MRVTRLHIQAAGVLALMAVIGWPEFRRPVRAVTVWRTNGPLTPRPDLATADGRLAYSTSSAAATRAPQPASSRRAEAAIAGTDGAALRTAAGARRAGARASVTGRARTSLNQPVPYARVVLRNRITGKIESRTTADENGQFTFHDLLLAGYIVELIGADGTVIAASELTVTGDADMQPAMLRVGLNATPRALFGTRMASTATATGGSAYLAPTANETISRAASAGAGQTTEPDADASPRH